MSITAKQRLIKEEGMISIAGTPGNDFDSGDADVESVAPAIREQFRIAY